MLGREGPPRTPCHRPIWGRQRPVIAYCSDEVHSGDPQPHGVHSPLTLSQSTCSPGLDPKAVEAASRTSGKGTFLSQKGVRGYPPNSVTEDSSCHVASLCHIRMCNSRTASLLCPPPTTAQAVPWAYQGHGAADGQQLHLADPRSVLTGTNGSFASRALGHTPTSPPRRHPLPVAR